MKLTIEKTDITEVPIWKTGMIATKSKSIEWLKKKEATTGIDHVFYFVDPETQILSLTFKQFPSKKWNFAELHLLPNTSMPLICRKRGVVLSVVHWRA